MRLTQLSRELREGRAFEECTSIDARTRPVSPVQMLATPAFADQVGREQRVYFGPMYRKPKNGIYKLFRRAANERLWPAARLLIFGKRKFSDERSRRGRAGGVGSI